MYRFLLPEINILYLMSYFSYIFPGTWEELVDKEDDGVGLAQYVEEVDLRLGAGLG